MEPLRILLVDKHILFRKAVTALLASRPSLQVVGEAAGGQDAIVSARETRPDVILMDVAVPERDGLEAVRSIKSEMPHVRIIAASISDADRELFAAVRYGGDGYLQKKDDPAQLFQMLEAIRLGEAPVSSTLAARILREFRQLDFRTGPFPEANDGLSATEIQVLELVAKGWSPCEIADALAIAVETVKMYLHNVLAKLHHLNRISVAVPTAPQTVGAGIVSE